MYKNRQCKDTILLIDALDECDDTDAEEVVDFLEGLSGNAIQSNSCLRICLSSRHYPTIDMKKKFELVLEQQAGHDHDISKCVQNILLSSDEDVQRQRHILEKANHISLWVVLVVPILNKEFRNGRPKTMWKKLVEIPSDLDQLFSSLIREDDLEDNMKTTTLLFNGYCSPLND